MSRTPDVSSARSNATSPQSPAEMVLNNKVEMSVLNLKMEGYVAHVQKLGEENAALKERLHKVHSLPDPNERRRLEAKIALLRQKVETVQVEKGNEELMMEKRAQDLAEAQKKAGEVQEKLESERAKARDLKQKNDQLKREADQLRHHHRDMMMKLETEHTIKQKAVNEYNQNQHLILAQKVAEQREEWQKEAKKAKDLLVRDFKNQVARLEGDLGDVEKEYSGLKIVFATLDDEIKGTNQKNQSLREENRNLQENLDKERADKDRESGRLKKFIEIKQGDIERLRIELQTKNQVVSEANDNNVSLRSEIEVYKRLLEQEEARLNLNKPRAAAVNVPVNVVTPPVPNFLSSPLVQSATPVTATPSPIGSSSSSSSEAGPSRKRPLEIDEETPTQREPRRYSEENGEVDEVDAPVPDVVFSEKKAGDAAIAEVRLHDETVEIRNNTNPPHGIDLNGWFVQIGNKNESSTRLSRPLRYKFPENTYLPEGESFDLKITGDEFNRSSLELVVPGFFVQVFNGGDELVAEVVLEEQLPRLNNDGCFLM